MMQHEQRSWHPRQWFSHRPSLLVFLGAAVLLAMLGVVGWGSVRAAPQSGSLFLNIVRIQGNILTLEFDHWALNETVMLSYSPNRACSPSLALPDNSFSIQADPFTVQYTWPSSGIQPGAYYLCATGSVNGTIASTQTITVKGNGTVESTPGGGGTTPTSVGGSSTVPPGATGTSGPGNQGTSTTAPNTNAGNTLIAIILLCVLVLALLAYLIRIWLQGRRPSGQPPTGGGQQGP